MRLFLRSIDDRFTVMNWDRQIILQENNGAFSCLSCAAVIEYIVQYVGEPRMLVQNRTVDVDCQASLGHYQRFLTSRRITLGPLRLLFDYSS